MEENFTKETMHLCKVFIVSIMMALLLNNNVFACDSPPGATATVSGVITCGTPTVTLHGESPTSEVTFHWEGPDGFESGFQEQEVSIPGLYILTVTDPSDGSVACDSIEVFKNIVQPEAEATVSDVLNCKNSTVTLHAVTNVGDAGFHWIGPGTYNSWEQDPVISVKGGYTLVVTDPENECASTATVYVDQDIESPLASAYVSGALTCIVNSVELTSSSPTNSVLYSWGGPESYYSDQQNANATKPGTYTVTVKDTINFCVSTDNIEVIENRTEPGAYISSTSSEITCSTVNATLTANANVLSVTYKWDGPDGYASTVQNPVVAAPGDYILSVTHAGNGCISKDTFNLVENKTRPGALAEPSGDLTCKVSDITLHGSSSASNVKYRWIGNNYSSLLQNPSTSVSGPYMLIVTDQDNGCTSSTFTVVQENKIAPASVTARNEGPLTCEHKSIGLLASTTSSGVSYKWDGPDFSSTEQNPSVTQEGTYYLTVTDTVNGCTTEKNTEVAEDVTMPASVTADNNGDLTCRVLNIDLYGNSTTSGVTYLWTGPDGFSSVQKNTLTSKPGKYYLTVTNPDNGCKKVDSTTVDQNVTVPSDVIAGNNGPLTCEDKSISLSGSSSTDNVSYTWTGPDGYSSMLQNPTTGIAGIYSLKVTDLENGCSDSVSTELTQDTIRPGAVTATNDGPLTCRKDQITLNGNSSSEDVIYSWEGPNEYTSDLQDPVVLESGTYSLTVEDPDNGCTSTQVTTIEADTLNPVAVYAENDGPITCTDDTVTLTGSSLTLRVTYTWEGPNNYISDEPSPDITNSGTYILTVTDTVNGCSAVANTIVDQDVDLPTDVTAKNDGPLTCSDTLVKLTASSTTGSVIFSWSGPNGYTSNLASPIVDEKGPYTVVVKNPENGCSVTVSTNVEKDTVPPQSVLASNNGPLTCETTEVTISGSSLTQGVSYSWEGPDNFNSTDASPVIATDGLYTVTIKHPINGCIATATTYVDENVAKPGVTTSAKGIFTCDNLSLTLTAVSPTSDVTYSWTGPDGFTSTEQNPVVDQSDTYYVTVKDPVNGCVSSSSVTTQQDTVTPGVKAEVYDKITCEITSVTIQASSLTAGVDYKWDGPDDFYSTEQYPSTTEAGKYVVMAKDPSNGCVSLDSLIVVEDTLSPGNVLATVSDIITCKTTSVTLFGSSTTSGVNYSWEGPDNFVSENQDPGTNIPGNYKLVVTNPANGCFDTTHVEVVENKDKPEEVSAMASNMINCKYVDATLIANTITESVSYKWSGPSLSSTLKSVTVSLPGTYSLTVTDTVNGCYVSDIVSVTRNIEAPAGITTSVSGDLTCTDKEVALSASSSTGGVEYSWSGPDDFESTDQNVLVNSSGDYEVTITNPVNSCFVKRTLPVDQNISPPEDVSASVSGDLTCTVHSVNLLSSSSTVDATFSWSSPGGFTSDIANPSVNQADDYTLVVENPINGCTETRVVSVVLDDENPAGVETFLSNELNCIYSSATLTGTSTTSGVSYEWEGPFGFYWEGSSPTTFFSGQYILTVKNPRNDCFTKDTIFVDENKQSPDLLTTGDTITCSEEIVTISATSSTPGATYQWSDNVLLSDPTEPSVQVYVAEDYTVTVKDPDNGCTTSETISVGLDQTKPELSASADGILTCSNPEVTLTATSETPGTIVEWDDFPGQSTVGVINPDTYQATAENPVNGCISQTSVIVTQNIEVPQLTVGATDYHLTCQVTSSTLTAYSGTGGTTLQWAGFSPGQNPITIASPGVYRATAEITENGCKKIDSVVVTQDIQKPDLTTQSATITCAEEIVTISASTSVPNADYLWSDNVLLSDVTEPSVMVYSAENYTITVTNPVNSCTNTAVVTVDENKEPPVCNIITPSVSPSEGQTDTLRAQELNNVTYSWTVSGDGWTIVSGQDSPELIYQAGAEGTSASFDLNVKSDENGCSSNCNIVLNSIQLKKAYEFSVLKTGDENLSIDIYPNPFSDKGWIDFEPVKDDHITIMLYTLNGALLETLFDDDVKKSIRYKVPVDGSYLEQGSYYCIIQSSDKVYTCNLIFIK